MLGRLLRVLFGFAVACLAAGLTKAFFATTPSELSSLPPDVAADRMSRVMESGIFAAIQSLIFSAPFALVAAAIGEWRRLRNWTYYALVGMAIALIGFLAHYSGEVQGQATIVNNYALSAFLTSGFAGGLLYWLFSGRVAGSPDAIHSSQPASDRPRSGSQVPNTGAQAKKA